MLKMRTYTCNDTREGLCRMERDVVYSTATGTDLLLQLILPEQVETSPLFPVIVFVQGSAWTFPVVWNKLPMMGMFAREGIAVAMITHRNCMEGHPAPAFLQDTKTAIRFLRANAGKWNLDTDRFGVWGTSSGGNTALLVGLTPDWPEYKTGEYADQSDAVKTVAECFGPTDLFTLGQFVAGASSDDPRGALSRALLGTEDPEAMAKKISPFYLVEPGKEYPPFMILQGDADPIVPYEQSTVMAEKLDQCGAEVEFIKVEGGVHERNFWNPAVYDEILGFFKRTL